MSQVGRMVLLTRELLAAFSVAILMSCSPTGTMRIEATNAARTGTQPGASKSVNANDSDRYATSPADKVRLDELWRRRSADTASDEDYPVGPGDVLTVSVPSIEELQGRKTRVSAKGTIELPLLGVVQVGGLTEEQVAQELDKKTRPVHVRSTSVGICRRISKSRSRTSRSSE